MERGGIMLCVTTLEAGCHMREAIWRHPELNPLLGTELCTSRNIAQLGLALSLVGHELLKAARVGLPADEIDTRNTFLFSRHACLLSARKSL